MNITKYCYNMHAKLLLVAFLSFCTFTMPPTCSAAALEEGSPVPIDQLQADVPQPAQGPIQLSIIGDMLDEDDPLTRIFQPTDKVIDVQRWIEREEGIRLHNQCLVYENQWELDDNEATLGSYGFLEGNLILTLFERNTRNLGEVFKFSKMNKGAKQLRTFSRRAPKWRIIGHGFNLEGKCTSDQCEAGGHRVWVRKGFDGSVEMGEPAGKFVMNYEAYSNKCPLCHNLLQEVNACGFYRCKYTFWGMLRDVDPDTGRNKICKSEREKVADQNGLLYFGKDLEDGGSMEEWQILNITVKPLETTSNNPTQNIPLPI